MRTSQRAKRLWKHYIAPRNFQYQRNPMVWGVFGCNASKILDTLDERAGINTLWRDGHHCTSSRNWWCDGNHNEPNYVGARLALHEQHLGWREKEAEDDSAKYFWGGALIDGYAF